MYQTFFKRFIEFNISLVLILLISPVILILAILLMIVNKGQAFFFQDRPGKNEKRIRIIKFKSMTDDRDENGDLLPDVKRITRIGDFCRKYSLDELPQLVNVLKGDMSLVGPRPLLFRYLNMYSPYQRRRQEVRPGITGLAQISGRNSISWQEKFNYDVYYIDNLTFTLDLKILWLTFRKVIKREGVNQTGERPMQPFNGDN
ncbi:MAG: sugar transferase [Ferruginibacter sp.]|nr:sugar transferase [Ferruginibacter sp.]